SCRRKDSRRKDSRRPGGNHPRHHRIEAPTMHPPVDDDLTLALEKAARLLRQANRLAVRTGAGTPARSGLGAVRGAGRLWEGHAVEDVATPQAFERDPTLVWRFYNLRRAGLRAARPNLGHEALFHLQERFGDDKFTLITQNVDGLHRAAGSRGVLELHGS